MFRLPVCPHCKTVYRYRDTVREIKKKDHICYHCEKSFRVKKFPYVLVPAVTLTAVCIAVNTALLSGMERLDLISLFAVTVVFICLIALAIPYFVKFKAVDDKDSKSTNIKDNNMKAKSDKRERR